MGAFTDFTLPLRSTVVCGMSSSGKTSFAIRYLLNVQAACRFIFDDEGQIAGRLGLSHASTANELEAALSSRWVLFNPHRMFPGKLKAGFLYFCQWAFDVSARGPGRKIFFADEIWRMVTPQDMPYQLALVCQTGRTRGMELMTATQLPHKLHSSITGQCTEVVSFRLDEPLALASVKEMRLNPDEVANLPLGKFLARNRLSGRVLSGRMF